MTLLRTPFAAARTRRLRALTNHLDDRLLADAGLPERTRPYGLDFTAMLFMRFNQ